MSSRGPTAGREAKSEWANAGRKRGKICAGGTPMSVGEEWEQLKTELQRDADRLMARATGTVIRDRIESRFDSDLMAV